MFMTECFDLGTNRECRVAVFQSVLFQTNAIVVSTKDLMLIVDPNWLPGEIKSIMEYVNVNKGEKSVFLLFTHSDYDHIIGYGAFKEYPAIASAAFIDNPDRKKNIGQALDFDHSYYIDRDYKMEYPVVTHVVNNDGQQLQIGETILHFYLSPGHNRDGIFTLIEPAGIFIAGDYLCEVEFPYIYHSSIDYEKTLKKVETLLAQQPVTLMVPGHGRPATGEEEIRNRYRESLEYIRTLRKSLEEGKPYDTKKLWERYRFPRLMQKFHRDNMRLIAKELKEK